MRINKSSGATRERADNSCGYKTQRNAREATPPAESKKHYCYGAEYETNENRINSRLEQAVKEPVQHDQINSDHQSGKKRNLHCAAPIFLKGFPASTLPHTAHRVSIENGVNFPESRFRDSDLSAN
jgi:hypothetical protein